MMRLGIHPVSQWVTSRDNETGPPANIFSTFACESVRSFRNRRDTDGDHVQDDPAGLSLVFHIPDPHQVLPLFTQCLPHLPLNQGIDQQGHHHICQDLQPTPVLYEEPIDEGRILEEPEPHLHGPLLLKSCEKSRVTRDNC